MRSQIKIMGLTAQLLGPHALNEEGGGIRNYAFDPVNQNTIWNVSMGTWTDHDLGLILATRTI